jgi:hypothetical protein
MVLLANSGETLLQNSVYKLSFGNILSMSDNPQPKISVKFVIDGQEVNTMFLLPKDFSTGSNGYYAQGKVVLGDDAEKGYQVQVQMIRIGSKKPKV